MRPNWPKSAQEVPWNYVYFNSFDDILTPLPNLQERIYESFASNESH